MASERPEFELSAPSARSSVGEQLRAARVQAGLSVESVAKQLKLAPRQVSALESDDVAQLPSGPFLRGFIRNYARLVNLDPGHLLGQDNSRRLAAPPLDATPPSRGEIRETTIDGQNNFLKWLIPFALLGVLLVGATWYEVRRPKTAVVTEPIKNNTSATPAVTPSPAVTKSTADALPAFPPPAPVGTPAAAVDSASLGKAELVAQQSPPTAAAIPNTTPNTPTATPASTSISSVETAAPTSPGAPKAVALDLVFMEQSWTEIRDGGGNVLTGKTQAKGSKLTVSGHPPFRFTIGNARSVALTRDGVAIDLAPRIGAGDVAKFALE